MELIGLPRLAFLWVGMRRLVRIAAMDNTLLIIILIVLLVLGGGWYGRGRWY